MTLKNLDEIDTMTTWRLNDHRHILHSLNTTVKAPESMSPEEVVLKVATKEELNTMRLVVTTEPFHDGTRRPVIHIYERV